MKMKTLNFLFISLLSGLCLQAQSIVELNGKISQIVLEPLTGNMIVVDKENISSVNPKTSQIEWSLSKKEYANSNVLVSLNKALTAVENNDFLTAFNSKDAVSLIDNSPYASIKLENNDLIINSVNGEVLYNTATFDYRILDIYFIPEEKSMLILGLKGGEIDFINFDLSTKQSLWSVQVGTIDGLFKSIAKVASALIGSNIIFNDKINVANELIYALVKGTLYQIDKATGQINWRVAGSFSDFYLNQNKDKVVVTNQSFKFIKMQSKLNILDAQNGKTLWKNDISTNFLSYLEDHFDKLLVAHGKGFNFYSYKDGKKIWKKDAKGSNIRRVIPVDQDYLYVAHKYINLVDAQGKDKWKRFINISGIDKDEIHFLGKVDNNRVFYLSDSYGNMVDYTTGKTIWKKNISFAKNSPLVYSFENDNFLVYNKKRIYAFNPHRNDNPRLNDKIEVDNDKTISSIEQFDWGICVVGQNDVIGLDMEGNKLYHNRYKEPGEEARRVLKTVGIIGSNIMYNRRSNYESLTNAKVTMSYRDANGNLHSHTSDMLSPKGKEMAQRKINQSANIEELIENNLLSAVRTRFNALKQLPDFVFVAHRGEDGPELIKVRKRDGKELFKIPLDSDRPMYEIDPVDGSLYYVSENVIKIYNEV